MQQAASGDEAVSDIVGSILLVAMLVTTSAVIALDLADREPNELTRADLDILVQPGANGWGSGDERIVLIHRGGHPVDADSLLFRLTVAGTTEEVAAPASLLSEGTWRPGQQVVFTRSIQASDGVSVLVVGTHGPAPSVLRVDVPRAATTAVGQVNIAWDTTAEWDATTGTGLRHPSHIVRPGLAPADGFVLPMESGWAELENRFATTSQGVVETTGTFGTGGGQFNNGQWLALDTSFQGAELPEMTACAWFQTTATGGTNDNWALLDFDRSEFFNLYVTGSGQIGFSTAAPGIQDQYVGSGYNDGAWHHVCAVYNGDKIVYVDGVEIGRVNNAHGGTPLGTNNERFGFVGDGSEATSFDGSRNNQYFDGRVDDVTFQRSAIDAGTAAALHGTGLLVSDWRDAGFTVTDSLVLRNVIASDGVTAFIDVDADGDGVPEGTSAPISLQEGVAGDYSVAGVPDGRYFRLRLEFDTTQPDASRFVDAVYLMTGLGANLPPSAAFDATCSMPTCIFDGAASTDPDGAIIDYQWDFGDGQTGSGVLTNHNYAAAGTYDVTLRIIDDNGGQDEITQQVTLIDVPPLLGSEQIIYRFDTEDQNQPVAGDTRDGSGNGNHGFMDAPGYGEGRHQGAATFTSNDAIPIRGFSYNGQYPAMTVAAWIRTTSDNDVIASFDRTEYWRLGVGSSGGSGDTGKLTFNIYSGGVRDLQSNSRIDDGQWHHVAAVFDTGTVTLYIDGNVDSTHGPFNPTFGKIGMTRWGFVGVGSEASSFDGNRGPTSYFNGDMDEFRLYGVALSQSDIQTIMG
ncbi:MAG: LamG-like jellyroll fold domain-containing protein [Thermoplasmatota archaeon]